MDAINFFVMHKIRIERMHFYRQFIASSESYLQSAVLSLMINRNLIEKVGFENSNIDQNCIGNMMSVQLCPLALKSKSC